MHYDKLVRDKIPEIIAAKGEKAVTHVADQKEFAEKLRAKLLEEVEEFMTSGDSEELADILEVIYALADIDGKSPAQLEEMRNKKAEERGGFKDRIVLEES